MTQPTIAQRTPVPSDLSVEELEGPQSSQPVRRHPWWLWAGGIAAIVVAIIGLAFATFTGNNAQIRFTVVGFTVLGPEATQLEFDLAKAKSTTVECAVEALAEDHSQVGYQLVSTGPSPYLDQRVTVTIPTTHEAVTAVVKSCKEVR